MTLEELSSDLLCVFSAEDPMEERRENKKRMMKRSGV